jgi:hypothetical protein
MLIAVIVSRVQTTDLVAMFLLDDETDYLYVLKDSISSYTGFIQDIRGSSSLQMTMEIAYVSGDYLATKQLQHYTLYSPNNQRQKS